MTPRSPLLARKAPAAPPAVGAFLRLGMCEMAVAAVPVSLTLKGSLTNEFAMSSFFFGLMIGGPEQLDPTLRNKVIADARTALEQRLAAGGEESELENLFGLPSDRFDSISASDIDDVVTASVDNFLNVWNEPDPPSDLIWRHVVVGGETLKIMCAGEQVSCDLPVGSGFSALYGAAALGIHEALGCQ